MAGEMGLWPGAPYSSFRPCTLLSKDVDVESVKESQKLFSGEEIHFFKPMSASVSQQAYSVKAQGKLPETASIKIRVFDTVTTQMAPHIDHIPACVLSNPGMYVESASQSDHRI